MEVLYAINSSANFSIGSLDLDSEHEIKVSLEPGLDESSELLKILGQKHEMSSPYDKVREALSLTGFELLMTIPVAKRNKLLEAQLQRLKNAVQNPEDSVYIQSYVKIKKFLTGLTKPSVCLSSLKSTAALFDHEHIARSVIDFGKSSQKSLYSMSGTATGRLTIKKGPNILTLPAAVRKSIRPSSKGSRIMQIDLIAAEPHLALLEAGKDVPDDIYEHVATNVLSGKVSRSQAKLVTLSALYGQSATNLAKRLPDSINARKVIQETKDYFSAGSLRSKLVSSLKRENLRNVLGRPLHLEQNQSNLVISYFLQSSVAELSIILFEEFCKSHLEKVTPIYVIHDALIFECEETLSKEIINKGNIDLSLGSWNFRVKAEIIA